MRPSWSVLPAWFARLVRPGVAGLYGRPAKCLIASALAKGRLSCCKRRPFSVRFAAFWNAKGRKSGSSASLLGGHVALLNATHYSIYKYIPL